MQTYREISRIEVIQVFENGDRAVRNEGDPSSSWIIPKATFEALYVIDGEREKLDADLENRFSYHAPKLGQPEKYETIRAAAKELAYMLKEKCPAGRESALALTNLEQAVFWANAAIARGE